MGYGDGSARRQGNTKKENPDDRWEEEYPSLTTLATRHHKDDQSLIQSSILTRIQRCKQSSHKESKTQFIQSLKLNTKLSLYIGNIEYSRIKEKPRNDCFLKGK